MSIASRITAIEGHIENAYDKISDLGVDLTDVDKNIDNISEMLEEVYEGYPKVTATGTDLTLNGTKKGKMVLGLKGNTSQGLPDGYQQVDYIESTGTQYIDTGVKTSNNTKIIAKVINTFGKADASQPYGGGLLGARKSSSESNFSYVTGSLNDFIGTGSSYSQITKNTNTSMLNIEYDNSSIEITCGNYSYSNDNLSISIDDAYNIYLFALNQQNTVQSLGTFKLYSFKMWNNNSLVRDMIPCYRKSDNVAGLYDTVNGVFYTNQGTGTFSIGDVAPNPNNKLDIHTATGENSVNIQNKNLFSPSNFVTKNNVSITNDGIISSTGMGSTDWGYSWRNWTGSLPAGTYQLSVFFSVLDTDTYPSIRVYDSSGTQLTMFDSLKNIYQRTRILTLTEKTEIGIQFKLSDGICTFQIEPGSTASDYVPHAEQNYPVNLCSKNLANIEKLELIVGSTGVVSSSANTWNCIVDTRKIDSLYISGDFSLLSDNALRIGGFNEYPKVNSQGTRLTYSANGSMNTASYDYVLFCFLTASGATINDIKNSFQIEKGSTATSYAPYFTPIELCKIGDYQDYLYRENSKWYKHKEIEKIELDGTENWASTDRIDGTTKFFVLSLTNRTSILSTQQTTGELSDKFIQNNPYIQIGNYFWVYDNGTITVLRIGLDDNNIMTAQQIKEYISNNNFKVYYPLKEPTDIEITDTTLIEQLEAIYKAQSYNDQTNINQTNEDLPFIIPASALKSGE